MDEPVGEDRIKQLLAQLDSADAYDRRTAAETIGEQHISDARLMERLKAVAAADSNSVARGAARGTLEALGVPLEAAQAASIPLAPPHVPLPPGEKRKRFIAGFLGWYLVNGLLWFLVYGLSFRNTGSAVAAGQLPVFLWCLNSLVPVGLAIPRDTRPIAHGILAALALNLAISLILGAFTNGICFIPFFFNTNY